MAGLQHPLGQAHQGQAGNIPDRSSARRGSRWWHHVSFAAALLACAAPSCGNDDDDKKPSGSSSNTTTAGSGGAAGRSGSGGGSATTTGTAPKPVACGDSQCTVNNPLSGLLGMFPGVGTGGAGLPMAVACCLDEGASTCGVAMGEGATCEAKATPDSTCPALDLGAAGALLGGGATSGCCIDGACGQDGAIFGRGCVENSAAASMVSSIPLLGPMIRVPPSQPCGQAAPVGAGGSGGSGGSTAGGAGGKAGASGSAAGKGGSGGSAGTSTSAAGTGGSAGENSEGDAGAADSEG